MERDIDRPRKSKRSTDFDITFPELKKAKKESIQERPLSALDVAEFFLLKDAKKEIDPLLLKKEEL